ncbi:MAG: hypothetical protein M3Q69_00585 [Acidobacteriota bacterium]|nr:hypothetical protein [Acidobacteriota bacterium]
MQTTLPPSRATIRGTLFATLALAAVAALHALSIPVSIWEYDECLFALGVEHYQPLAHHPPPPGYPIYMGFAKLVNLVTHAPFDALRWTSIIGVVAGLIAFAFAFRALTDGKIGVLASCLLYACPALLVSGTLSLSDSGALALFGFAIWACARGNPFVMAIACAATIGWRAQFCVAIVPMFVVAVLMLRTWRDRINALATFALTCVAWLLPLVAATGGTEPFTNWIFGQAAYYAAHDADMSRSGYSKGLIALRFIAHPWGPKWLALPLLAAAAAGVLLLMRRRNLRALPLLVGCSVYLAFALATMDPADAVRYAIPSLPIVALLAAVTLSIIPLEILSLGIPAAYAAGAFLYAYPVLGARTTSIAPPTQAASWIRTHLPKNVVVLMDPPLKPHAEYLLRDRRVMRTDAGLAQFGGDPSTPIVFYADGERMGAPGVTFRWPDTDAYRKLTRQHYGAVSVIPLPPSQRYKVISGVYPLERQRSGHSWRWLAARATIELPNLGGTQARIVFRTPPEYPLSKNRVRVRTGNYETTVTLGKNAAATAIVPLAQNAPTQITIEPEQTFVPANVPGANNRDLRVLSVTITSIEQLGARPGAG